MMRSLHSTPAAATRPRPSVAANARSPPAVASQPPTGPSHSAAAPSSPPTPRGSAKHSNGRLRRSEQQQPPGTVAGRDGSQSAAGAALQRAQSQGPASRQGARPARPAGGSSSNGSGSGSGSSSVLQMAVQEQGPKATQAQGPKATQAQGPKAIASPAMQNKREKREKQPRVKVSTEQALSRKKGCCYGCGAKLQTEAALGPGYVPPAKYEVKARHKQLDKVLCERCTELCNGAMIPAVEDFTQKLQAQALRDSQGASEESLQLLGKSLVTPEQLRKQLSEVAATKAVVVLLVDLTDASGTLMARVRDMVGRNPIVLVGTKMDLLPEGTHPRGVAEWLQDAAARKALNVVSCHLVSSHTGEGMAPAIGKICRERKGRDVYVVGAANVGKSAFVRAMLKEMAKFEGGNFDAAALANGRYLPVESPMPGTTLGFIPLRAFESGGTLYDTPGVHLHHRVPHMLSPLELKLLHPRKRLQPILPPTPATLTQESSPAAATSQQQEDEENEATSDAASLPGYDWTGEERQKAGSTKRRGGQKAAGPSVVSATYSWSDLVRLDVVSAPPTTGLAFYGPTTMRVAATPLNKSTPAPPPLITLSDASSNASSTAHAGAGSASTGGHAAGSNGAGSAQEGEAAASSSVAAGRVLSCAQSVAARGGLVPHLLTVKVDGSPRPLADVAISGVPGWVSVWAPGARRDIQLRVWAPRGVEVFLRPPLPCQSPFKALVADTDEGDDGELALDPNSLQALAAQYEGGGAASNVNDAAWWEAAIAELEAFEDDEGEDGLEDEDEEEVEEVVRRPRLGRAGTRAGAAKGGERIIMQATVEDILKRPRLEDVFGGMEDEDEGEDGDEDEEEQEEVEVQAKAARRGGPRRWAGPSSPVRSLRGRRALSRTPEDAEE